MVVTATRKEADLDDDDQLRCEEAVYSADGVDLTLIRWMLSLTPSERLDVLEGFAESMAEIRARNVTT